MWFHLHGILETINGLYSDRKQVNDSLGPRCGSGEGGGGGGGPGEAGGEGGNNTSKDSDL